jgi:outer membrane protein assembly factor BamB
VNRALTGKLRSAGGLLAGASILCVSMGVIGGWPARASATAPGTGKADSWTVYHGDGAGTGVAAFVRRVEVSSRAWTSPTLDGQIYSEPLVFGRRVYVATENNTVYGLSAATGSVKWSVHLGKPVPASSLPCGNIAPTVGITGTPVIDPVRREIFVVADVLRKNGPAHILFGLSTSSGKREMSQRVDPPGQDPTTILQRTALTLSAGQVVFGFGGNYGDCGSYRGRLVAAPETGGNPRIFTVDAAPDSSKGAIWMGGAAPAVDGHGNLWVSTGNSTIHAAGHAYDHSDGVLELSPTLGLLQFFAPASWPQDNANDIDMSTEPVLLGDSQVLVAGKSGRVFLLDQTHLGGIGGQQAVLRSACDGDIDGGSAVAGQTVYLPCVSGIVAVRVTKSPPGLRLLWKSGTGGGPPILAGGLVWTIGQDGKLYELEPATGKIRRQTTIGVPANHFPTPGVGAGLLLAACAANVIAFPAGALAEHAASRARTPAKSTCSHSTPGHRVSRQAIAAITLAGLLVIIGLGWLILRRRTRRT